VDHEGEVLESLVTKTRDKKAALKFLKKAMKKHGGIVRLNLPDRVGTRSFGCLRVALLGDNQANKRILPERRDSGRQEIGQSV
jgi:putative transposase